MGNSNQTQFALERRVVDCFDLGHTHVARVVVHQATDGMRLGGPACELAFARAVVAQPHLDPQPCAPVACAAPERAHRRRRQGAVFSCCSARATAASQPLASPFESAVRASSRATLACWAASAP